MKPCPAAVALSALLLLACLVLSARATAADEANGAAPAAPSAPAGTPASSGTASGSEEAARFVSFVLEDDTDCLLRDGKHVLVRNLHPSRTVRVWLDRYYRNGGTGDRSRSDLKPGAEAEPLGCSRIDGGVQEWRIVRAVFVD